MIGKGLLTAETTTPEQPPVNPDQPGASIELSTGDQVVIFAPAYNKALSTEVAAQYYQAGVDVTVAGGEVTGYGATSTWTVTKNPDGTYSFANGGKNIAMAAEFSSMKLGEVNDDWTIESLGGTLFNIKNVVRGNYMEWYASKENWSTYNSSSAATDDQFQLSIYVIGKGLLGATASAPQQPPVNPPAGNDLTIEEAIAMGTPMTHNTYTSEKYKVTGVIDEIYDTAWGNMYIKDAAGNRLKVYGTYDATGDIRYDALTVKPVVGDTVVLLGIIGNYNEEAQMKSGWIVEHLPSGNPAPEGPVIPEGGVSLDLTNKENRTAYATTQQVWQQNGIKLTNNKAGSQTNVGDFCPIRLYMGSEVVIEYAGMTKLVFDCTGADADKRVTAMFDALSAVSGATVTKEGRIITVVLAAPANTFTFTLSGGQGRASTLYVYTN